MTSVGLGNPYLKKALLDQAGVLLVSTIKYHENGLNPLGTCSYYVKPCWCTDMDSMHLGRNQLSSHGSQMLCSPTTRKRAELIGHLATGKCIRIVSDCVFFWSLAYIFNFQSGMRWWPVVINTGSSMIGSCPLQLWEFRELHKLMCVVQSTDGIRHLLWMYH